MINHDLCRTYSTFHNQELESNLVLLELNMHENFNGGVEYIILLKGYFFYERSEVFTYFFKSQGRYSVYPVFFPL